MVVKSFGSDGHGLDIRHGWFVTKRHGVVVIAFIRQRSVTISPF